MKEFMRSRQIDALFHFTRANNLQNIFRYGLLPKENLLNNGINVEFNDNYRYDGCENALCASLGFPNYKMFYRLQRDNPDVDWVVIKLDANILLDYDYDCAFCVTNAGSAESYSVNLKDRKGIEALKKLYEDYPGKPSRQEMNLKDCYPTNPQAEVLIFGRVPVKYIKEVYFLNDMALHKYRDCIPDKIRASVNTYWFSYREDWHYWKN